MGIPSRDTEGNMSCFFCSCENVTVCGKIGQSLRVPFLMVEMESVLYALEMKMLVDAQSVHCPCVKAEREDVQTSIRRNVMCFLRRMMSGKCPEITCTL